MVVRLLRPGFGQVCEKGYSIWPSRALNWRSEDQHVDSSALILKVSESERLGLRVWR